MKNRDPLVIGLGKALLKSVAARHGMVHDDLYYIHLAGDGYVRRCNIIRPYFGND
jgi:hypothetical protein